jgi:hypothetical protein
LTRFLILLKKDWGGAIRRSPTNENWRENMLFRSLPYWIVPILLLAVPPAKSRGQDPSRALAPKAAGAAKVADDPTAVEAFKKAGLYPFCRRDKDGDVISVFFGALIRGESHSRHQLRLKCLENLKGFPKLRKIETITDNPNEELSYIGELTKLETLEVHYSELGDSGLIAIEGMVGLKRLSLNGSYKLTDAGLEYLAGLKSLEDLDLSNTPLRGTGLSWLRGLKKRKKLDLSGSEMRDAQLVHVAAFGGLEELDLGSTPLTFESVRQLSQLTRLRKLDLYGTRIDDSRLADLAAIGSLEELDLGATKVTSKSLHELSRLTRLTALNLGGTERTRPGAEDLKKVMPKLTIYLSREREPGDTTTRHRHRGQAGTWHFVWESAKCRPDPDVCWRQILEPPPPVDMEVRPWRSTPLSTAARACALKTAGHWSLPRRIRTGALRRWNPTRGIWAKRWREQSKSTWRRPQPVFERAGEPVGRVFPCLFLQVR